MVKIRSLDSVDFPITLDLNRFAEERPQAGLTICFESVSLVRAACGPMVTRGSLEPMSTRNLNSSASSCASSATSADQALLDRCLAGDDRSWHELYAQCQTHLAAAVRSCLGRRSKDQELVEELVAQVWYSLLSRNAKLLASFQVEHRCRLATFVGAVARNLVRNSLRSERRRRERESRAGTQAAELSLYEEEAIALLSQEFLQTLTPREEGYVAWCLTPVAELGARGDTFAGTRNADHQIRHRLRKKVRDFFGDPK